MYQRRSGEERWTRITGFAPIAIHTWEDLETYLYRTRVVSRTRADALFREAMEALGVPAWQRWAMWAAVRVGGHWAYAAAQPRQG